MSKTCKRCAHRYHTESADHPGMCIVCVDRERRRGCEVCACARCGRDKHLVHRENAAWTQDIFLTLSCELCVECAEFDARSRDRGQTTIWQAIHAAERAR